MHFFSEKKMKKKIKVQDELLNLDNEEINGENEKKGGGGVNRILKLFSEFKFQEAEKDK